MPKSALQTRQQILQQAHRLFRKSGFFRTGMDEIAEASGVTKRTLYHHFDSKDALLAAVLTAQHERVFTFPNPYGVEFTGTAQDYVGRLFEALVDWSATPHWSGSGFSRLAMELADMPGHPARRIAHQHKASVERSLGDMLATAGVREPHERARELILIVEGAMVMLLIHGDPAYARAAASAASKIFDVPDTDHGNGARKPAARTRARTRVAATSARTPVPGTV
jgi:AcrR family transcriptional regulator